MKKNTLMILVVSAIFGAMLVGCGTATEGNNDATTTSAAGGKATATPADAKPSTETNAPAAGANTPAPDATKK